MVSRSPSLAGRAVLAVTLFIGFYVLALGIAALLAWLPFGVPHVPAKISIVLLLGAAVILWSILPRIDRFTAPGPALTRDEQPRLFDEIERIAESTGQAMPEDVYLVNDVNAFVTERGGIMGLGSKRVMGLGLPLMHGLTVSEVRAVVAHEFGHFHGGDTRLGPWLYKTRAAIGRTVENLVKSGSSVLHMPFLWYGNLFLRMTQSLSRAQEFAADRLAAEVVGAQSLIDGLRKIARLAPGFAGYLNTEYVPVVRAGYRPPMLNGFRRFLEHARIESSLAEHGQQEEQLHTGDVYDSHPPLGARIAALDDLEPRSSRSDSRPATDLLADVARLELNLLSFQLGQQSAAKLSAIEWEDVCAKVMVPSWEGLCRMHANVIAGRRIGDLAATSTKLADIVRKTRFPGGDRSRDEQHDYVRGVLQCALALALTRNGWTISSELGDAVIATKGDDRILPFGLLLRFREPGELESWKALCARQGLADVSLELPT